MVWNEWWDGNLEKASLDPKTKEVKYEFYIVELREYDYLLLGMYFTLENCHVALEFIQASSPGKNFLIWTTAELAEWKSQNLFGKGIYGN